jgi:hypothetical protein
MVRKRAAPRVRTSTCRSRVGLLPRAEQCVDEAVPQPARAAAAGCGDYQVIVT